MRGATFLLVINCAIGLSFALTFFAVTRGTMVRLGYWCGFGFLFAASTVIVEAFAWAIPWDRVTSGLSFSFLILALALIAAGLLRHYRPGTRLDELCLFVIVMIVFHQSILFELDRDTVLHAYGYQLPFAILCLIGALAIVRKQALRPSDWALLAVLVMSALQFIAKATVATSITTGPSVQSYVFSQYALISQTVGAVLSLFLGLTLLCLVLVEVTAERLGHSEKDGLSGVLLRMPFLEKAEAVLKALPARGSAWLILADLDHFKSVNDRFGHAAGDEVIRAFGYCMSELAATNGTCGRVGGEEFAILLVDCDLRELRVYVESVRAAMSQQIYTYVPLETKVTASYGVTMVTAGETVISAMRRADIALYEAKNGGRDGYRISTLETPQPAPRPTVLRTFRDRPKLHD